MLVKQNPRPLFVGVPSTEIDNETAEVLNELRPLGFILFARNCESEQQIAKLCAHLAEFSPLEKPLIFIDQEGGRVARVKWEDYKAPCGEVFGKLFDENADKGVEATRLNAFVMGAKLRKLGITADCAPVADVADDKTHDVIGDRAYSKDPKTVSILVGASISGFMAGGVYPVIKHAPGHGKARCDSHKELPIVEADVETLEQIDFLPFKENNQCPFIMSAHIQYTALDDKCATDSKKIMSDIIRNQLGMTGILMSDDINMEALEGSLLQRAQKSLSAGCDVALHCNGKLDEMRELLPIEQCSEELMNRFKQLPSVGTATDEVLEEAQARVQELLADVR